MFRKALMPSMLWMALVLIAAGAASAQERIAPPPIDAYGALPAIGDVAISPDGLSIAFIRHNGDVSEIVALELGGEVLVSIDTSDRRVRDVTWASNDHVVVASIATEKVPFFSSRAELVSLDIVNVRTRRAVRAMSRTDQDAFSAVFSWERGVHGGDPVLYVEAVTKYPGLYGWDLYRVDLDTGRGRRHAQGDSDTRSYVVAQDGFVPARVAYEPERGRWRLSANRGGAWREIQTLQAPLDTPSVLGLGRTADTVLVSMTRDGRVRLAEVALGGASDQEPVDIGPSPNRVYHDSQGLLVGIGYVDTYQEYEFFNPGLTEAWDTLKAALPGMQLALSSYSDDLSRIVLQVEGSGQAGAFYLYDAKAQQVSLVGRAYPAIGGEHIAEVRVVSYKAEDGLDLMGYLTLPPGREPRDLPLVMMPHGGPASRDHAGFDWWAQAMASRGYAVFQPQFRGSNGFGVDFLEAGYGEWGRKMQSDVSDAIDFLSTNGVVDPDRVCVVGASYGGYVALAGMTLEEDVYRCAVSVAGVSDLREMLLEEQRQGARGDANPAVRYWARFMGASGPGDTSIDAYSPARRVTEKTGPILLIHGRNDTVVPLEQSTLMHQALQARGRLVVLEGEDHYLSLSATRRQMLDATIDFLEEHNPPH